MEIIDVMALSIKDCLDKLKRASGSGLVPHTLLQILSPFVSVLVNQLVQLMSSCIPVEQFVQISSQTSSVLFDIVIHPLIFLNENHLSVLDPYLHEIDSTNYRILIQEKQLYISFQNISKLSSLSVASNCGCEELLSAGEKCLAGVSFNWSRMEQSCIHHIVNLHDKLGNDQRYVDIIFKLISHEKDHIKMFTYAHVKNHFTIFTNDALMKQLMSDLLSSNTDISSITSSILIRWVNNNATRNKEMAKLIAYLPYMECSSTVEGNIMGVVYTIIDHAHTSVKVCSLLRMMFSNQQELKDKALLEMSRLAFQDGFVPPFLNSISLSSNEELSVPVHLKALSNFQAEDVQKLLSVIKTEGNEELRVSAMDQLAMILQDYSLHEAAVREGLLAFVKFFLDTMISHKQNKTSISSGQVSLMSSCLSCLQLLVLTNESIRASNSNDFKFLIILFKGLLFFYDAAGTKFAQILALLAFTPIAVYPKPPAALEVKIERKFRQYFKLPFPIGETEHDRVNGASANVSLLESSSAQWRLWTYYSLAVFGGIDNVPYDKDPLNGHLLIDKAGVDFGSGPGEHGVLFSLQCLLYGCPFIGLKTQIELLLATQVEVTNISYAVEMLNIYIQACFGELRPNLDNDLKTVVYEYLKRTLAYPKELTILPNLLNILTRMLSTCDRMNLIGRFQWLLDMAMDKENPLYTILNSSLETYDIELADCILKFIGAIVSSVNGGHCLPLVPLLAVGEVVSCSVARGDLRCSLLHSSLRCLALIVKKTSLIPIQSSMHKSKWIEVTTNTLTSLNQTILAILYDRGTMSTSYINKGLLYNAVTSTTHLLPSIISHCNEDWLSGYVTSSITWLHSTLYDRDPKLSCAAYSVLSILSSHVSSVCSLVVSYKDFHTHGLLGIAIDAGIDTTEWTWTRHQALDAASNLILTCHDNGLTSILWKDNLSFMSYVMETKLMDVIVDLSRCFCDKVPSSDTDGAGGVVGDVPLGPERLFPSIVKECQPLILSGLCRLMSVLFVSNASLADSFSTKLCEIASHLVKTLNGEILNNFIDKSTQLKCDVFDVLIEMYTRITALLHCFFISNITFDVTSTISGLLNLIKFKTSVTSPSLTNCIDVVDSLCSEAVKFLISIAGSSLEDTSEKLQTQLIQYWLPLTNLLNYGIGSFDVNSELTKNSLHFLSSILLLFSHSASPHSMLIHQFISLLDNIVPAGNAVGAILSEALIDAHEATSHQPIGHIAWTTLTLLVSTSVTAKDAALKAGLVECTINKMSSLRAKIPMDSSLKKAIKNKRSNQLDQLIGCFKFMQNLLHKNHSIKCVAIKSGLVTALRQIWSLCIIHSVLLDAYLKLLLVVTANCTEAHIAVAYTRQGTSLFQEIIKLTSTLITTSTLPKGSNSPKGLNSHYPIADLFSILANCVMTQECRSLIKKTNFLSSFLQVHPKTQTFLSSLWLKLLVNLTFTTDGQSTLAKLNGSIDLLCNIWTHVKPEYHILCVIVLRNLCFYGPIKTTIVTNGGAINVFTKCLLSNDTRLIALAATAIWALLSNNTKLRIQLCDTELHKALSEAAGLYKDNNYSECHIPLTNAATLMGCV
jgi:hypothetical protein